jgi:hypothetical protein
MIEDPQFEPLSAAEQPDPDPEMDDENGIAAQAARQGAGDIDLDALMPDDGSGQPLVAEEMLSADDDDDLVDAADDGDADDDEEQTNQD